MRQYWSSNVYTSVFFFSICLAGKTNRCRLMRNECDTILRSQTKLTMIVITNAILSLLNLHTFIKPLRYLQLETYSVINVHIDYPQIFQLWTLCTQLPIFCIYCLATHSICTLYSWLISFNCPFVCTQVITMRDSPTKSSSFFLDVTVTSLIFS